MRTVNKSGRIVGYHNNSMDTNCKRVPLVKSIEKKRIGSVLKANVRTQPRTRKTIPNKEVGELRLSNENSDQNSAVLGYGISEK